MKRLEEIIEIIDKHRFAMINRELAKLIALEILKIEEEKQDKKSPEQILSEITGIPIYRITADDMGEYVTKSAAIKAMIEYNKQ